MSALETNSTATGSGGSNVVRVINTRTINIVDVWENLWHCRDFELEHFWHRSAFLSGMLILCFTGYGCLIGGEKFTPDSFKSMLLCEAVCLLSIVFSFLWIMMAKASKFWYEKYECAIIALTEFDHGLFDSGVYRPKGAESNTEGEKGLGATCFAGFGYEKIPKYNRIRLHEGLYPVNCLLSRKGGAFSPSKITIFIGQLSLIIWFVLGIAHFVAYMGVCSVNVDEIENALMSSTMIPYVVMAVWIVLVVLIGRGLAELLKSTSEGSQEVRQ